MFYHLTLRPVVPRAIKSASRDLCGTLSVSSYPNLNWNSHSPQSHCNDPACEFTSINVTCRSNVSGSDGLL